MDEELRTPQQSAAPQKPRRRSGVWLLGFGLALVLGAVWFFLHVTGERPLPYLGETPITASINRVSSAADTAGYCETEVWRLSESSLALLRRDGAAALGSPHLFKPGFQPARWRELKTVDTAAEPPWNARKCSAKARREFGDLVQESAGLLATMRREDELGAVDRAVFILALDSGLFARAVFSDEATAPLRGAR